MARILVIDDDLDICQLLAAFLGRKGYEVHTAGRGARAVELLREQPFDVVLCDHRLPDADSFKMLEEIRTLNPNATSIIITGYSDVRIAVELIRRGAFDYVVKPLYPDEILMRIQEALAEREQRGNDHQGVAPHRRQTKALPETFVQGPSVASELVRKHVELVAPTDMTVLISGETGTGKEYVARAIHMRSKRADKPFVAVDCGALPKELAGSELFGHTKGSFTGAIADKRGSFEEADGGTLFLDEIGNLTYENQMKLLRVLQERTMRRLGSEKDIRVDVRVLAATNTDLRKAVAEGRFREDLFHRINEFSIELLPLRDRREDIEIFANHFLELASQQLEKPTSEFAPIVRQKLLEHQWHGNLRELGNVVRRSVLLADGPQVTIECLPVGFLAEDPTPRRGDGRPAIASDDLRGVSAQAERQAILAALERTGFNKSRTATLLNIDRKTLYNKLKALGIEV